MPAFSAALPTLQRGAGGGARVIAHVSPGAPGGGGVPATSFAAPVADYLAYGCWMPGKSGCLGLACRLWKLAAGELVLENVRFNPGEKGRRRGTGKAPTQRSAMFSSWMLLAPPHRAQASTHGVAKLCPTACAGPLLAGELEALEQALANPARPLLAIVGGSKVSTKLTVLETLSEKVDQLVVGGGIANTFLAASGCARWGKSLCEHDLLIPARSGADGQDRYSPADRCGHRQGVFRRRRPNVTKPVTEVGG